MNVYIACYIPWYVYHDIYFWSNKSTYSARQQNTCQVIYHVIYIMIYIMVYTMIFGHAIYHAIYHTIAYVIFFTWGFFPRKRCPSRSKG